MRITYFAGLIFLLFSLSANAVEPDKQKHFAAGAIAGAYSFEAGCFVGAAKEGYDKVYGGTVEFADFAYTCAGSGLTALIGRDKSLLYRWDVAMFILDGLSTDNAIRQGGREVGFPKYVIGEHPSTAKIAAFTAFKLWLLYESESWRPVLKKSFQWTIAVTGPAIVYWNYSIDFKQ